jgi:hypothetical protein
LRTRNKSLMRKSLQESSPSFIAETGSKPGPLANVELLRRPQLK